MKRVEMATITHDNDHLGSAVSRLGSEAAFTVFGRARALQALGRDIIHFEIGEPDFDTPEHIKAAGKAAIDANFTHYAPNPGLMEFRELIADYATRFRGLRVPFVAENVVVAPGAKAIIWNLLTALLDPGDEMVYAEPAYPTYAAACEYLHAIPVPVPLRESRKFSIDLDELTAKVNSRTKVLIINSPSNPTGGVLTHDDFAVIADLAEKFPRFVIMTDEIYSRNIYGERFESFAQFEHLRDRTIVVDGFSKAYAMTGWRLGYCLAPPAIARAATLFANNTYACVSTFVQKAGMAALTGPDEPVVEMNEIFRKRRDVLVAGLNELPNVSCLVPDGAFYAFPNISKITRDDQRLGSYLLEEAGVGLLGGSCFGEAGAGYLRISYASTIETLEEALRRMRVALPKYRD
jgi:aspartate/methionine/tyrosine aminotransferase